MLKSVTVLSETTHWPNVTPLMILSRERSPFTIFAEIRLGRDGSTDPGLNNLLGEFAHLFVSGAKRLDSGFVLFSQKTLNTSSSLTMVSAIHRA
jgi:hypothetical protein